MRPFQRTLFATLFILALPPAAYAQCAGGCGDCDQDGVIDVLDSFAAAQIAVGGVAPSFCQRTACDADGSGIIDILDARLIAQVATGQSTQLTCPPIVIPPQPAIGYCVGGLLRSPADWRIVVSDIDPFTLASFTSPPGAPAVRVATVNNPTPATDTVSTAGAFIAAINGTLPFADLLNGGTANFGALPAGSFAGVTCFAPYALNLGAGGALHYASVGILYDDGSVCFPLAPPFTTTCSFNPDLVVVDLTDVDDNGVPYGLEDLLGDPDPDGDGCNDGSDGTDGGGDGTDGGR